MPQKSNKRIYISDESRDRLNKYIKNQDISLIIKSPVTRALDMIIQNTIDEHGETRERILFTDEQHKIIKQISEILKQTTEQTTHDLVNYAILIYETNISLRDLLSKAAPLMMDSLVKSNPGIAKEILKGLKTKEQNAART